MGKELSVKEIATIGPISPHDFAKAIKQRVPHIAACFEIAVRMRAENAGTHRLALEIGKDGRVLRSEWLSDTEHLEATSACVSGAITDVRFAAQALPTIADVQFYVSGTRR